MSKSQLTVVAILIIASLIWLRIMIIPEIEGISESNKPCITKQDIWHNNKPAQVWSIEGDLYLAKQTPNGGYEVVGLYSRFKN